MSNSINLDKNAINSQEHDFAVQTALTGSTVYALPRRTSKRNVADNMLRIMGEDGPHPMVNRRPAKRVRNAADQFNDDHHGEYEAIGQTHYDKIKRVHTHNNAYPKMYDELDKRRSTQQVGISGLSYQMAKGRGKSRNSGSQDSTAKLDPARTCPKCIKRKKRIEAELRRKKRICKKCREQRRKKESRKAEMKNTSTFKSCDNLLSVTQEDTTQGTSLQKNQENIVLKSKSSHKRKVGKKPGSEHSDVNYGQPDTETDGPSVSSYNSFKSSGHEPMIE